MENKNQEKKSGANSAFEPDLQSSDVTNRPEFAGIVQPSESIGIERNTKGFNYSIKILSTDTGRLFEIEKAIRKGIAKIKEEEQKNVN